MHPFFWILIACIAVGGIICIVIRVRPSDFNKCIGCPHSITCDIGDPSNICHKENKKNK